MQDSILVNVPIPVSVNLSAEQYPKTQEEEDDMLLIGNDKEIQDLKTQLFFKFDMKDLGAANYILGMEIKRYQAKRKLWLNRRKYVETIFWRFNM